MSERLSIAQAAWGEDCPDWIAALVRECDLSSQNKVANRLGITASTVSQALRRSYPGNMASIEARVRTAFMSADVACPALGKIGGEACLRWRDQSTRLTSASPLRVQMFRACRKCPVNKAGREDAT